MNPLLTFPWQQQTIIEHTQLILKSYLHWLGTPLLEINGSPIQLAQSLFEAPFIIVSHGTEADPIFNYGNRQALALWEINWEDFIQLPSRKTAEPMAQEDRNRLLEATTMNGYMTGYSGIRISCTGKRFKIEDVIIWNLIDEHLHYRGQAATYTRYSRIQ